MEKSEHELAAYSVVMFMFVVTEYLDGIITWCSQKILHERINTDRIILLHEMIDVGNDLHAQFRIQFWQ